MLQVSPAVPPRYKRRKVSAIRQFPRGCGPNAVKLSPKPEIDTSSTVGFEDGNVVETGRLIGASDVGEEPVVQGLLSASHPERMEHPNSLISDVLVNNTAETNPNSLISDVLVNNTAETNPEEVKLEVDGLVKEISELAKLQNGNCYSKLYRLPKRRKVSAIRQFPPGCGLNAGCGSKDGHQLVGAAPTLLKAESLSRKEIDEANKNSMDDGSLRVTSAETVEVQTRWNAGNEAIQDNGEGISADDGIRPQIASPKSKTWDGEKRKYALGQQEVAGDSASIVASTKLHVLENVPRVKQQVVKDISAGIADAENSLNSDNFIVKQVTSVGDFPKIASAESVGFMNKIDSKLTKGKEKSFEKNVMVRSDSYKNFDGSEVQGTSVHGEIKSSLKNGSKGNLFRPCLDKIPEGTKGHHQPDWKLNKANTSSSSHLIVKSQFRSKDKDGRPLAGNQSIKENELNRDGSKSVKRRPSSEIGEKECLPEEIGDSLEAYGDRMIIQALMATENCPWRNLKKRASSSGSVVPKSKTKTEKRLVDRKSASMGFSFSQQKNKDLIEDDDNVLEEVKTRKALTVYQKQNELSTTMTPFVPHEFSHKSSDNEAVARHKVKRALRLFQLICRKLLQGEESRSKRFGKANRIDLQASSMLKENGEWVNSGEPLIGHVPGVEIGDEFHYRVELAVVGLHRPFQSGIDYTKKNGIQVATSIVASGGYQDDMDSTDVLIYSGSGGNTVGGDKQPGDQKLERGNLALKNSIDTQLPVRVIHGFKEKGDPHDARSKLVSTFTYDGLYDVEKYWQERGPHGFNVFKFQLKRKAGQPELPFKELKRSAKLKIREGLCVKDISQGKEKIPISVVNTLDTDQPMPFRYTTERIYPSWYVKTPPRGCDCTDGCSDSEKCACAVKNGGEIPYNFNGAIVQAKPLIYECGPSCKCPPSCHNRVSQHSIRIQLEIFKTSGRGWGVRSLKSIPSGSFICEYIGELLQDGEAEQKANDDYLFDIGNNYDDRSLWQDLPNLIPELQSSSVCDTVENVGFTIDAAEYGNIGRFINHSCSPNLYAQNVLYDHDDKRVPHIMFYAVDNIPPLQELTYHYNYTIDQVRDSEGKIKQKACHCGSPDCCGRLY